MPEKLDELGMLERTQERDRKTEVDELINVSALGPSEASKMIAMLCKEVEKVVNHTEANQPNDVIDGILAPIIGGGHGLLEGEIGVAKTLTVKAICRALDLIHKRIDCTPDLFPSDVVGGLELVGGIAVFVRGPALTTHILQIEEINRANPKAQAGSISIMEERLIHIGGKEKLCRFPFIVLATQNPIESVGVFPLPEAQLDRFMVKVIVPYPIPVARKKIVKDYKNAEHVKEALEKVKPVITKKQLAQIRKTVNSIEVGKYEDWICYFCEATRPQSPVAISHGWTEFIERGASPRGIRDLAQTARAFATIKAHSTVQKEDLKRAVLPVLRHRIFLNQKGRRKYPDGVDQHLEAMLETIPIS